MGTPDFSIPALDAIIKSKNNVVAVYTQPPRPAGRGKKLQKSPIHIIAEKNYIDVLTPLSFKNEEEIKHLRNFEPDLIIVSAYGIILPQSVLDICPCYNIHASILPRWRGAAPIHRAIEAGDKTSGITIMQMDAGLDTGDMLIWQEVPIDNQMTTGDLHDELKKLGGKLVIKSINNFSCGDVTSIKQDESQATYAKKITKQEAEINWKQKGEDIIRKIRAFNPYPGAYFMYEGEKFKILQASYEDRSGITEAACVIDEESLAISCLNGVIIPKIIQRQGKKAMYTSEMLRGFRIKKGTIL